mmetsp:Transcript_44934/g.96883  ORF Transcript_44934/g.96883 Transcript_44934/m.96883 type:complete len:182 (-) Transcript_44934:64-609(-)
MEALLAAVEEAVGEGDAVLANSVEEALRDGCRLLEKIRKQTIAKSMLKDDHIFYKVVARIAHPDPKVGRKLVSFFDGVTEYSLGAFTTSKTGCQRLFVYRSLREASSCPLPHSSCLKPTSWQHSRLEPSSTNQRKAVAVILLVAGIGQPEYHGHGKFSFPTLLPLAVLANSNWKPESRWKC